MTEKLRMVPAPRIAALFADRSPLPASEDRHRAARERAYARAEAGEYVFTPPTWAALALALLATAGCGDVLGVRYDVVVEPAFEVTQRAQVFAAVRSWERALPLLTIQSERVGECTGAEREVCFRASTEAWIQAKQGGAGPYGATTSRHGESDSADVYVALDSDATLSADYLRQALAHEFGHAMGLEHVAGANLMYWEIHGEPAEPTCADAAQWLSIRHMDVRTELCPDGGSFTYYH